MLVTSGPQGPNFHPVALQGMFSKLWVNLQESVVSIPLQNGFDVPESYQLRGQIFHPLSPTSSGF